MENWQTPTTYLKRFGDAMQLLCSGERPSDELMAAWLDPNADDHRLQEFALEHAPSWSQGIAVIDAARLMAGQPTEIVTPDSADDHELEHSPNGQRQQVSALAQRAYEESQEDPQDWRWQMGCLLERLQLQLEIKQERLRKTHTRLLELEDAIAAECCLEWTSKTRHPKLAREGFSILQERHAKATGFSQPAMSRSTAPNMSEGEIATWNALRTEVRKLTPNGHSQILAAALDYGFACATANRIPTCTDEFQYLLNKTIENNGTRGIDFIRDALMRCNLIKFKSN